MVAFELGEELVATLAEVHLAEPAICAELERAACALQDNPPAIAREILHVAADQWEFLARPDEASRLRAHTEMVGRGSAE